MPITILVNFNTFYVDNIHEKIFDEYMLRNPEGFVLTDREKILNINIVKCKDLWYYNEYQGKFEPIEEDLMLLCAAMVVDKQEDFVKILDEVRTKPEIKELMEGILQKEKEIVINMYKDNCPLELICKYTNLSVEEVKNVINLN